MQKKRKCCLGIFVLMAVFLLAACQKETENEEIMKEEGHYRIYFLDKNTFVTSDYYTETKDSTELAKELLSQMGLDEENNRKYGNVYVEDSNVANGVAYVYFNDAYGKMDNVYEVLFRASVVKTLSQLSEVNYVYFYVNNKPLTYENGQVVGLMAEGDFIADSDSDLQNLAWSTLTLYFANNEGTGLVERQLDVAYVRTVSLEKVIVEQLIQGPEDDSCQAVVPSQVKVLGTTVRNEICYVNLDSSFIKERTGVPFELTVYSIVNSLCELNGINKVQFQINGDSHVEANGISFDTVFERNLDLIKKEETQ